MNRGETLLSICIGIRKAFDTVDFQTVLSRVEALGVRRKCLKWFENYLEGRSLKGLLNGVCSAAFPVTCGVPQGSVLGPLLYPIYVDLTRLYLKDGCLISFSDDTTVTVFSSCVKDLVRKANLALERLGIFTSLSLLCVNVRKTFLMTLCRVGTPLDLSGQITLCGNLVQQVDHLCYLGFIFIVIWHRNITLTQLHQKLPVGWVYFDVCSCFSLKNTSYSIYFVGLSIYFLRLPAMEQ